MTVQSADKLLKQISDYIAKGYSPSKIKSELDLDIDLDVIRKHYDDKVNDANKDASNSRAILRQTARDMAVEAMEYVRHLISGSYDIEASNISKIKYEAAKFVISNASKLIQEDALTLMMEQTSQDSSTEKPLVFEVKVDESGKTTHEVKFHDNN